MNGAGCGRAGRPHYTWPVCLPAEPSVWSTSSRTQGSRFPAIRSASSRTAPVSTRRPCKRWRVSSTCPRRLSSCPPRAAMRRVRIFTPSYEMPFAGHPTLGTAHVCRALGLGGDALRLDMQAGLIEVIAQNDRWTLTAPSSTFREVDVPRAVLAAALGLAEADIGERPLWVKAGKEQLIVPLPSLEAVRRAAPQANALCRHPQRGRHRHGLCVRRARTRRDTRALLLSERRGDARGPRDRFGYRQFRRLVACDAAAAARTDRDRAGRARGTSLVAVSGSDGGAPRSASAAM